MKTHTGSIEINAPLAVCYDRWLHMPDCLDFEQDASSIQAIAPDSQWVCHLPYEQGEISIWRLTVKRNDASHSVRWIPTFNSGFRGEVEFQFEPVSGHTTLLTWRMPQVPSEEMGVQNAEVYRQVKTWLTHRLAQFQSFVEKGKLVSSAQPQKVVVNAKAGAQPELAQSSNTDTHNTGYDGPYGLDWDSVDPTCTEVQDVNALSNIGLGLIEVGVEDSGEGDEPESETYLSEFGAVTDEDLIDLPINPLNVEVADAFEESMDVNAEDMENFTEDLDEEIDSTPLGLAVPSRWSSEEPGEETLIDREAVTPPGNVYPS